MENGVRICLVCHDLTVALDLLRKTQGRRRATRRRRAAARSSKKLERRLRGVMRTARRASNVEVPSFLRQLDRPILEKQVSEGSSDLGLNYAVASMQGWRAQMEDAHTCMPQLKGELREWGYFAVFDGHAGTTVAQYCSKNLLDHILSVLCLPLQGSLDNISIIIVCFPGAPQVTPEALTEIIQMMRSREEDPDLLYVIKFLAAEEMPGLPPGGGITSKRDCIISAYQKHVSTIKSQEPMDIEGSEEDSN